MKTYLGVVDDESGLHYLRPETAQGIFVNFSNVLTASRKKPPFGIGQVGKAFRNEITPGNFIFRTREFEQMEIEFFTPPAEARRVVRALGRGVLGLVHRPRHRPREPRAASTCPKRTARTTPPAPSTSSTGSASRASEWGELMGVANRTDFDLTSHSEASGKASPTSTRPRARSTCRTSSSRRSASRAR